MFGFKFPADSNHPYYGRILELLFVGGCTTFAIILDIFTAWHGFNWPKKFEAICLLTALVVGPIRFMRAKEEPSREMGRADIAMWGYLCVMMAAIIFAR